MSTTALSAQQESTLSQHTLSESLASTGASVLEPQDAKEIAAKAANMKTSFFIVVLKFLKCKTINCCIKTLQRYGDFRVTATFSAKFSLPHPKIFRFSCNIHIFCASYVANNAPLSCFLLHFALPPARRLWCIPVFVVTLRHEPPLLYII